MGLQRSLYQYFMTLLKSLPAIPVSISHIEQSHNHFSRGYRGWIIPSCGIIDINSTYIYPIKRLNHQFFSRSNTNPSGLQASLPQAPGLEQAGAARATKAAMAGPVGGVFCSVVSKIFNKNPEILGISSSQLTNKNIFQRGG